MAPPTRRSQTRPTTPAVAPEPVPVETKPPTEQLLLNTYREEKFKFSFQDEELTAFECAQKMASFKTKEEFLAAIPIEEVQKFLVRVIQGQPGRPLKCYSCENMYASALGFWNHFKKCSIDTHQDAVTAAQEFIAMPYLWLRVKKQDQEKTLKNIVGTHYKCFSPNCGREFKIASALIKHLEGCIEPAYLTFMNRPDDFRKMDNKTKQRFAREAMKDRPILPCLVTGCDQEYNTPNALVYHVDRCGVEKSAQPWKCYRCGYTGVGSESEAHLLECAKRAELNKPSEIDTLLASINGDTDSSSAKKRRVAGGTPRVTARKDGSTLLRFRKSTVNREFNGVVSKEDQRSYEQTCNNMFETWKTESDEIPFCDRLKQIEKAKWTPIPLDENDEFYKIFNRKSVTLRTEKAEPLQESLPSGIRIDSLKSEKIEINEPNTKDFIVAYCGAPINGIKVAPGKTSEGEEVVCVTTFANEGDLESTSSVAQFWRHSEAGGLKLWFLLEISGNVLCMRWLQKHDSKEPGLIGYVAFATSLGTVLIYRVDSDSAPLPSNDSGVSVVRADPHLILSLPKSPESSDESFLNATIKVEGEEVQMPIRIDESTVPILKVAWTEGGGIVAATTALGQIVIWNLDSEDLGSPRVRIGQDWNSLPTDISFLNADHLVVGFREKMVKVMNIETWEVKLEENTVKTAGSRVHTDPRIIDSFFTFQSDYNFFPYANATSISYIHMDVDSMNLILIPTGNTHQLMAWDVAMCAPLGTLVSCGVDGRLVASASGRLLRNIHHPFFANRSIMSLKRRRVLKVPQTMEEFLKEPKTEDAVPSTSKDTKEPKAPLEESLVEHENVCQKMWLEVGFDQVFEPTRVELSCLDQRIESLNCVDANTNRENPVAFTGGEAGLLFAVSSKLILTEMKL
ncbi:unnamed protein product [Caenorhabditis brenneri]